MTVGAHIDLHLPNGLVRQYSLCGDPGALDAYTVGVGLAPNSRGGSSFIHHELAAGTPVSIAPPRNHFALGEHAESYRFVAGGIGITPIIPMINWCIERRKRKKLFFCATDADDVYCCGPAPLMDAVQTCLASHPPERLHFERFSAGETQDDPAGSSTFTVVLKHSGERFLIPADKRILDVLEEAGYDLPFSCREGICGSCQTVVCEGEVDHRDSVLSDHEREMNRTMMICVSRAKSGSLMLDL